MMSLSYEYAIEALAELESQKGQISNIENKSKSITENIKMSEYILDSFNSIFKRLKISFFKEKKEVSKNPGTELGSLLEVNKLINKELDSQNNTLSSVKKTIINNNIKINDLNKSF